MHIPYFNLLFFLTAAVLLTFDSSQAEDCDGSRSEYFEDTPPWMEPFSPDRYKVSAEYLYWKIEDTPSPIDLVETGTLADPGTDVALGGRKIKNNWRSGGRVGIEYWFDNRKCYGVEASYFYVPKGSHRQTVDSSGLEGSAFLTIPYFNVTTGNDSFAILSFPLNLLSIAGDAALKIANRTQGGELNGLASIYSDSELDMTFIAGLRYWNFDDRLKFSTSSSLVGSTNIFQTEDKFHTKNNFYGGQIGVALDYRYKFFSINLKGKIALGATDEKLIINGSLFTNGFDEGGQVQRFEGGYFALPTNIGHHHRTGFSVLPEASLKFGFHICQNFSLHVGYNFLYVTGILWASKQLNSEINPTQSTAITGVASPALVGTAQPRALMKTEGFWVQGITAGLTFSF